MIIFLKAPANDENIKRASTDYPNYVKITIDIEKEIVAIGGEYHADVEKRLLELGSKQEDIWGGGINLITGRLEVNAVINYRSRTNSSAEILDETIRKKFLAIAKKYLNRYAKS